ncbi:hypothetical protein [Enterovibrio baiacu]|uniref:hypothetical protein n=1 Tax=Enterovibrio baiacu TaxID=2491023 RepID=UPI0010104D7F|nr:hypothetical protein [Enterovibrio baiacu]MBE1273410.1 hypothetical protein [Enterovibrio baiacu]
MTRTMLTLSVFIGVLLHGQAAFAQESSLTIPKQPSDNIELTVHSNQAVSNPSELLAVFVGAPEHCCDSRFPIAGKYRVDGNTVLFDPAFDFVKGQQYTISTRGQGADKPALEGFVIKPDQAFSSPQVTQIYPSGDDIPENTLRFYIQFSSPMQPHMATRFIKLVNENGITDDAAFMHFKQELWSEDRTRLTLLMDPGRIKRGVAQNLTLGPALLEGSRYSIIIKEGWPTANNGLSTQRYEKTFTVSKALRHLPSTNSWQIDAPETQTKGPLTLRFDRPFDQQLLKKAIRVLDSSGQIIAGNMTVDDNETRWQFTPDSVWQTDSIQIEIDARLEDVAGNNFRELMDHTVTAKARDVDQHTIVVKLAAPNSDDV